MVGYTIRAVAVALVGSALWGLAPVGPAEAHTSPISSDPKPNTTITALPETVTMTFDGPLSVAPDGPTSLLVVADPMHQLINAPTADVEGSRLSTVLNPSMLMDGTYTVSFRAFAEDGYPAQGSWTFTVGAHQSDAVSPTHAAARRTDQVSLQVVADGSGVTDGVGASTGSVTGSFDIDLAKSKICYRIVDNGLSDITAAHVHSADPAAMTISDGISLPIDLATFDATAPVCSTQDRSSLARLADHPERYVLMVHTQDFPDGAVAGAFQEAGQPPTAPTRAVTSSAVLAIGLLALAAISTLMTRWRRSHSRT